MTDTLEGTAFRLFLRQPQRADSPERGAGGAHSILGTILSEVLAAALLLAIVVVQARTS
jgi:hypothetical protein